VRICFSLHFFFFFEMALTLSLQGIKFQIK